MAAARRRRPVAIPRGRHPACSVEVHLDDECERLVRFGVEVGRDALPFGHHLGLVRSCSKASAGPGSAFSAATSTDPSR